MAASYSDDRVVVHLGDCLDVLRSMPDCSVDAIVTDPPYGLSSTSPDRVADTVTHWVSGDREYTPKGAGFMDLTWDAFVPPVAVWDECLRVLKPGGHALVFAGSRTADLMGLALRLSGFDIRDTIMWLYGSGFPKSLDASKALDKDSGVNRERQLRFTAWIRSTGLTAKRIDEITGSRMGGHYTTHPTQPAIATADMFDKLRPYLPEVPEEIERLVAERTGIEWTDYVKRVHYGERKKVPKNPGFAGRTYNATAAAPLLVRKSQGHSAEAKQWQGWGTGLKPAHEPVIVARKPFVGNLAGNVREHGTGGLNIDGCRVDARWPANVAVDGSQADMLGGNAKYFYCAKASQAERPVVAGVRHPTVKPLALMRWLVRLVTVPGGVVLDPFAGSGSTVEACLVEGFNAVAVEREPGFVPLIVERVRRQAQRSGGHSQDLLPFAA